MLRHMGFLPYSLKMQLPKSGKVKLSLLHVYMYRFKNRQIASLGYFKVGDILLKTRLILFSLYSEHFPVTLNVVNFLNCYVHPELEELFVVFHLLRQYQL
jgi:hypothetical protein